MKICALWEVFPVNQGLVQSHGSTWKTCMRGCRWGEGFYSFIHLWECSVEWKKLLLSFERFQTQSSVSGRSRYSGRGGLYYQFELVILPDIIMLQILQCSSFVHHTRSAKVKSTPLLQVISPTLLSLLFSAVCRRTVIPCLVPVLPTSRNACWHTSGVHLYVFAERACFKYTIAPVSQILLWGSRNTLYI